jgi:hypothetical protein
MSLVLDMHLYTKIHTSLQIIPTSSKQLYMSASPGLHLSRFRPGAQSMLLGPYTYRKSDN